MTALLDAIPTVGQPLVRPMTTADYAEVARLEESEGLLSLPEDDWRALWLENPLWPALGDRWPLGWVLERGGTLVGAVSNVPMRYVLGGRTLVAAAGRGWVVAPAYRGFALWLLDEYFNQDADLFFNTTVNGLADETFQSLGSPRVPVGDWTRAAFRVTSHGRFATAALRIKGIPGAPFLGPAVGAGLWAKDLLTARRPGPLPKGWTLDWTDAFDGRF
ncbi:MAG: GNAT family N-acetyltransferase, partial [Thermoleophilia bacterium]|nr:GNAT family N-acetyltransferase [Thermoleophilia bacterium]